jgi:hypothetical protein
VTTFTNQSRRAVPRRPAGDWFARHRLAAELAARSQAGAIPASTGEVPREGEERTLASPQQEGGRAAALSLADDPANI